MKTDRELLELAARAAGIELSFLGGVCRNVTGLQPMANIYAAPHWNPLTDAGDALRLAVRLNISVHRGFAYTPTGRLFDFRNHANMVGATCRAIVNAAAAIGEGMK